MQSPTNTTPAVVNWLESEVHNNININWGMWGGSQMVSHEKYKAYIYDMYNFVLFTHVCVYVYDGTHDCIWPNSSSWSLPALEEHVEAVVLWPQGGHWAWLESEVHNNVNINCKVFLIMQYGYSAMYINIEQTFHIQPKQWSYCLSIQLHRRVLKCCKSSRTCCFDNNFSSILSEVMPLSVWVAAGQISKL